MQAIWAILTFCLGRYNSARRTCAFQIFIGIVENSFCPGNHFLFGSWNRKDELGKRSCIFHVSGAVVMMVSDYLMEVFYHLAREDSFAGWYLLSIVDCIISHSIALAGYQLISSQSDTSRATYISARDRDYAWKRMILKHRNPRPPYTSAEIEEIPTSWNIYGSSAIYILFHKEAAAKIAPMFAQFPDSQYLKGKNKPQYIIPCNGMAFVFRG